MIRLMSEQRLLVPPFFVSLSLSLSLSLSGPSDGKSAAARPPLKLKGLLEISSRLSLDSPAGRFFFEFLPQCSLLSPEKDEDEKSTLHVEKSHLPFLMGELLPTKWANLLLLGDSSFLQMQETLLKRGETDRERGAPKQTNDKLVTPNIIFLLPLRGIVTL